MTYAELKAAGKCTNCWKPSTKTRCAECREKLRLARRGRARVRRCARPQPVITATSHFDIDADRREEWLALSYDAALWRVR